MSRARSLSRGPSRGYDRSPIPSSGSTFKSPDTRYYDESRRHRTPDRQVLHTRNNEDPNTRRRNVSSLTPPLSSRKKSPYPMDNHSQKTPSSSMRLIDDFENQSDILSKVNTLVIDDIEDGMRNIIRNAYREQDKTISSLMEGLEEERREELESMQRQHAKDMQKMLMLLEKELTASSKSQSTKLRVAEEKLARAQTTAVKATDELERVREDACRHTSTLENDLKSALLEGKKLKDELERKREDDDKLRLRQFQELDKLTEALASKDEELKDAHKRKNEIILQKNEEIRSLKTTQEQAKYSVQERVDCVKTGEPWEVASGLTRLSDFEGPFDASNRHHVSLRQKQTPPRTIPAVSTDRWGNTMNPNHSAAKCETFGDSFAKERGRTPPRSNSAFKGMRENDARLSPIRTDTRDDLGYNRIGASFSSDIEERDAPPPPLSHGRSGSISEDISRHTPPRSSRSNSAFKGRRENEARLSPIRTDRDDLRYNRISASFSSEIEERDVLSHSGSGSISEEMFRRTPTRSSRSNSISRDRRENDERLKSSRPDIRGDMGFNRTRSPFSSDVEEREAPRLSYNGSRSISSEETNGSKPPRSTRSYGVWENDTPQLSHSRSGSGSEDMMRSRLSRKLQQKYLGK